jgi:hypothetical protein
MGQTLTQLRSNKRNKWVKFVRSLQGQYTGFSLYSHRPASNATKWNWFQLCLTDCNVDEYKATLTGEGLCTFRCSSGFAYVIPSLIVVHVEHSHITAVHKVMVYINEENELRRDHVVYSCCNDVAQNTQELKKLSIQNRHCKGELLQYTNTVVSNF